MFFRLLLAIPHLFWLLLWSVAAFTVAFVVWLAVLFERRAPRTLHGFLALVRRATQRTSRRTSRSPPNPYPSFTGSRRVSGRRRDRPARAQGRWGAAFRLVLAVPALLLSGARGGGLGVLARRRLSAPGGARGGVAFLGWFACLARARMPRGMRDLGAYGDRLRRADDGYLLLVTDRYPARPGPR